MSIEKHLDMVCGPPGSGKTEFAKWYAAQQGAPVIHYDDVESEISRWSNGEQVALTSLDALFYMKENMARSGSNQYEVLAAQANLETMYRITASFENQPRVVLEGPFFTAYEQDNILHVIAKFAQHVRLKVIVNGYWMDTNPALAMERVIERAIREVPGIARGEITSRIKPLYDNPIMSKGFRQIFMVRSSAPGQYEIL